MRLDATVSKLSCPTRRAIVKRLVQDGEVAVGDLAGRFATSLLAVVKHIDLLVRAGLVERERRGRRVFCHLRLDEMREARAWLERNLAFWGEASMPWASCSMGPAPRALTRRRPPPRGAPDPSTASSKENASWP